MRRSERRPARRGLPGPALALALALALAACGGVDGAGRQGHATAAAHSAMDHAAMDHGAPPAAEPGGLSIYHAASMWTDQAGRRRALGSLAGSVRVVAMVYTSCGYACPRLILDMKRIESELGPERLDRVGFVLVSIDPARDTPGRLAEFAEGARLEPSRWTLLTAGEDDVLELAALLGVQYRRTAGGEFVHSNVLTVLDAGGAIAHRQEGLGADPAASLAAIRRLLD